MATQKGKTLNMEIDEDIHIYFLKISDTQAIDISLIRSKNNKYVAINRMHKTKSDNEWKHSKGMWIPYEQADKIADLIHIAHEKGLKLYWDMPYKTTTIASNNKVNEAIDEIQFALDRLKADAARKIVTVDQLDYLKVLINSLFK